MSKGRRRRRPLDLLPLLDVIMVVLFAFAVIQETRLDEDAQRLANAELEVSALQSRVGQAAESQRLQRAAADAQAAELAHSERRAADLSAALTKLREARWPDESSFRRDDVLDKLLDQNAVVEVEIGGLQGPDGIINRCCVRAGPRDPDWDSCGEVPHDEPGRAEWLRTGAGALVRALRDTRGGRGVTIIRQDAAATWLIGARLDEVLRRDFPEHKFYNDGVAAVTVSCSGGRDE
ncbi:MAG: hypothetical protein R3F39_00225 [Myxococcota bacterium]